MTQRSNPFPGYYWCLRCYEYHEKSETIKREGEKENE